MTRFEDTPVRRRADGSIDTAFYIARAREARAAAARGLVRAAPAPDEPAETPRRARVAPLLGRPRPAGRQAAPPMRRTRPIRSPK